jgi:hypothetical protein
VVPVPPGGASDFIARKVGQKLSEAVGQPVVILAKQKPSVDSELPKLDDFLASRSIRRTWP